MNHPDLVKLHDELSQWATRMMAESSFKPEEFIPTAFIMSPEKVITLCGFPMEEHSLKAIGEAVRGMRGMFRKEASEGRLLAYGFVCMSSASACKADGMSEADDVMCYILEHECGEGWMIEQNLKQNADGKIELGAEQTEPLREEYRIWVATDASVPEPDPAEEAKDDSEPMTAERAREFIEKHIPEAAESYRQMIKAMSGTELDYSAESISRLDGIIDKYWPDGPALPEVMTMTLGSYLGESIRRIHGGHWAHDEKLGFHVVVGSLKACPFNKTRRRLLNGEEDSIGAFYKYIQGEIEKTSQPAAIPPLIPPLAPAPTPGKSKKALLILSILAIGVLLLAGGVYAGYRIIKAASYAWEHPAQPKPGELEFRQADKQIIAGNGIGAFGNSPEATRLARKYSESLKILRDNSFSKGGDSALSPLEGEFLTYCQLNTNSCVFLVHVPELRRFDSDAKKAMADLAWRNAQSVLESAAQSPPQTVVVGVKGLMFYDAIMIGRYETDSQSSEDGIVTRGSGFGDMKLFYPYFASPAAQPGSGSASTASEATNDLVIQSAKFGVNAKMADVTDRFSELIRSRPDGFIINATTMGIDPKPGKKKHLVIHYLYKEIASQIVIPAGTRVDPQKLINHAETHSLENDAVDTTNFD